MLTIYGETRGKRRPLGPCAMAETIEEARAIVREKKVKGERAYITNSWTGERVE